MKIIEVINSDLNLATLLEYVQRRYPAAEFSNVSDILTELRRVVPLKTIPNKSYEFCIFELETLTFNDYVIYISYLKENIQPLCDFHSTLMFTDDHPPDEYLYELSSIPWSDLMDVEVHLDTLKFPMENIVGEIISDMFQKNIFTEDISSAYILQCTLEELESALERY